MALSLNQVQKKKKATSKSKDSKTKGKSKDKSPKNTNDDLKKYAKDSSPVVKPWEAPRQTKPVQQKVSPSGKSKDHQDKKSTKNTSRNPSHEENSVTKTALVFAKELSKILPLSPALKSWVDKIEVSPTVKIPIPDYFIHSKKDPVKKRPE